MYNLACSSPCNKHESHVKFNYNLFNRNNYLVNLNLFVFLAIISIDLILIDFIGK